jgi:hypothetical protein
MNEFVLSGLVRRRAALAGEIEATHETLRKMVLDLENLDATIVQFDPVFRVEAIKPKGFRPPSDWSNRGQMSRIILSVLRQASEPLTTRDIAASAAHDKVGWRGVAGAARKRACPVRSGAGAVHALGS